MSRKMNRFAFFIRRTKKEKYRRASTIMCAQLAAHVTKAGCEMRLDFVYMFVSSIST